MKIYQVPQETRALLDVEENQADLKWAGTEAPTPPPPAELVSSSNHDTHSASATRRREEFFPDWAPRYSQARRNYRQVVKKFPDPELHSYSSSGLPERYTELRHALAKAQVEMSRKAAAGTSIEVIDRQARTNQTLSDNLQKFWAHWIEEKGGLQSLTPEARAQYQADLTLFDSLSVEGRFMRFWGQAMQAKPAPIPQEGRAFQGWFPRKPGLTPMEEQGVEAAALADLLAAASGDAIYLASVKRRLSELAPKYPKLRLLGF